MRQRPDKMYNDTGRRAEAFSGSPPNNPTRETRLRPVYFFIILGAGLFIFIEAFSVLSPILLSLLLILFISLAFNPLITRLTAFAGGRKVATGLVASAFLLVLALTCWAAVGPLKAT